MPPEQPSRVHLWISGRVQGVFFRQETARLARAAGVAGWVRNLGDGRVEAVFEGDPAEVQSLVRWATSGPPMAYVEHVETEEEEPGGEKDFRIR
ncbi:MAG TPA: acylphosphatase [Actinomycetota bacterium]|nr:acylphosphatase [Actinomycetota bacterium]